MMLNKQKMQASLTELSMPLVVLDQHSLLVGLFCKFTGRHIKENWHVIGRVMTCHKNSMTLGLYYQRYPTIPVWCNTLLLLKR